MDKKNHDKKITLKTSTADFAAGTCFLLSGVISLLIGETRSTGIIYMCLGALFLGLGADARSKEKNEQSEDREK